MDFARSLLLILATAVLSGVAAADRLSPEEEAARIDALRAEIEADGRSFEVAPNSFTNIPWEEFRERYLGLRLPAGVHPQPILNDHGIGDRDLPTRWDWREHGAVPGIRHQGNCGSCWDFSAAGTFESTIMLEEGFEVDISEQHALVCNEGYSSCSGGWMQDAYELWQDYGAIAEEDMRYEADDTIPCPGSAYPPIVKLGTVTDISPSVSAIKEAIYNHGPVSTTMMVHGDFVPYAGGCYDHVCNDQLNHAVVLIGWDDDYCDGNGAWIMRNSWGTDWGLGGYAYMAYGAACIGNNCTYVSYIPIADLLGVVHEPVGDTAITTDPYEIRATIISSGGDVDLTESFVAYRINMGSWNQLPFSPAGNPDEYRALVPAQPAGTKVDYYIHAEDTVGQAKTVPIWAPEETHVFIVGEIEPILFEDFEVASGWTVGAPGDDATTGVWEHTDPQATTTDGYIIQPEDDHTSQPGHLCFVTDGRSGSGAGDYDVDGGRTTLTSPVYDLSGYELVVLDYWRWYTNRRGSNPNQDVWEVSVRSGGSAWVPIEYTVNCRENWSHQVHILNDFIDLGSDVQFRFVASDQDPGSLVEALVDDFSLRGVAVGFSSVPGPSAAALHLSAGPNPCLRSSEIAFRLPSAGPMRIRVLDCAGRQVRLLHDGILAAGPHRVTWDGRDDRERLLPSGSYYVQAEAMGAVAPTVRLLLLH